MNWDDYISSLTQATGLKDAFGQQLLNAMLPRIVEYAELRMFRDPDLDFLATRTDDASQTTTPAVRDVQIPSLFLVIEQVRLITPLGARPEDQGATRIPLLRTTRAFIDITWPISTQTAPPRAFQTYYAVPTMQSQGQGIDNQPPSAIIISPTPDGQYVTEFFGTFRPTAFSETHPETFLSIFLPDLLFSASMIFAEAALKKNFGVAGTEPGAAVSWEMLYQQQKKSAAVEEARKWSRSAEWSSQVASPVANIPRTSLLPMPSQGQPQQPPAPPAG